MSAAMRPIVNIDALEYTRERKHGERFEARSADVAGRIGARRLGYNVTRVAPGKSASPFHCHQVGEELFFILEGRGTLRFGGERLPVRAGDFIACPAGGPEVAHQLVAAEDAELAFIAIGTRPGSDIWQYPDSGKWGAVAGRVWPEDGAAATAEFAARYVGEDADVDYWVGE